MPEETLLELAKPVLYHRTPEAKAILTEVLDGLKYCFRTTGDVCVITSSGTASVEAAQVSAVPRGGKAIAAYAGRFGERWHNVWKAHGIESIAVTAPYGQAVTAAQIEQALKDHPDAQAVCVVHSETSTGVKHDLQAIGAVVAKTNAVLIVDSISGAVTMPCEMDAWGIDCAVGGSQKGLMLPTGFAFTGASAKAMAAHKVAKLPRFYLDWTIMMGRGLRSFVGTVPVALFYGLQESIRLLEEEGKEGVYARHARLAEGVRRCVQTWAGANDGPQFFCTDPARRSNSVTAVLMPEGRNAEDVRAIARQKFNVSLGGGLGKLDGKLFRIGHMGDLNEPMVLGTLASVEMALKIAGVPHAKGGVDAAMEFYSTARSD